MDIDDALTQLEQSRLFCAWSKQHRGAYLAHLFCMIEGDERTWQVGYAHDGLITVFVLGDGIEALPADKPFGGPGSTVPRLDRAQVKLGLDAALGAAAALQEKKYPANRPFKTIVILQIIDGRVVYNITYVTASFKTLNIRVAADDGRIVSDQLVSFFSVDNGTSK